MASYLPLLSPFLQLLSGLYLSFAPGIPVLLNLDSTSNIGSSVKVFVQKGHTGVLFSRVHWIQNSLSPSSFLQLPLCHRSPGICKHPPSFATVPRAAFWTSHTERNMLLSDFSDSLPSPTVTCKVTHKALFLLLLLVCCLNFRVCGVSHSSFFAEFAIYLLMVVAVFLNLHFFVSFWGEFRD